jgi:dolichol-phosphate mannosyltransferase
MMSPEQNPETGIGALVIIPTYNEAGNLGWIVDRLLAALPAAHILVVDDGSTDGTGGIADRRAADDPRIHVMHREGKLGLGSAYIAGFRWGIERGFMTLVEMDADGSHPPESLPAMLALHHGGRADLVIGSRWVPGGSVVNWPRRRQLLSRAGNAYARFVLRLAVKDVTAGFRVYSASDIAAMDLDGVDSKGYCFQVDMTLRVLDAGGRVAEHPIEFRERERGESKMSRAIVLEAMARVTLWGVQRVLRRAAPTRA